MYYRDEISMDIAMRLLDKLTELSNKKEDDKSRITKMVQRSSL